MKKTSLIILLIVIVVAVVLGIVLGGNKNDVMNPTATLKTNQGDIVLELYQDTMPITVGNFVKLANDGFYNRTTFHRVIEDFMIQGGDPNGDGTGGPGYTIEDEFNKKHSNVRGTISMANTGAPNSGGSQFFINVVDNTGLDFDKEPLTSKHPVFGEVTEGMDVVDTIVAVPTGPGNKPVTPVIINEVIIEQSVTETEVETETETES